MAKTANPKTRAGAGALSLKISLKGTTPPVWRRLVMQGKMTLGDLHLAIQASMGWDGYHLHDFRIDGRRYGDPETTDYVEDEDRQTLNGLVKAGVSRFTYTYDFGDDWEHAVLIEKRPPPESSVTVPRCMAGSRACPPEDCGGTWGYEELLQILADPAHKSYEERKEWVGEEFDPDAFDIDAVNAVLAARF